MSLSSVRLHAFTSTRIHISTNSVHLFKYTCMHGRHSLQFLHSRNTYKPYLDTYWYPGQGTEPLSAISSDAGIQCGSSLSSSFWGDSDEAAKLALHSIEPFKVLVHNLHSASFFRGQVLLNLANHRRGSCRCSLNRNGSPSPAPSEITST